MVRLVEFVEASVALAVGQNPGDPHAGLEALLEAAVLAAPPEKTIQQNSARIDILYLLRNAA